MAYKVFAQDVAAPFSHMVFYSLAMLSKKAEKLIGLRSKSPLQEIINTNVRWSLEEKNTLALEKKILKKFARPIFLNQVIKESYSSFKKLNQLAFLIKDKNFRDYSSQKLAKILKNYLQAWIEATIWGHIVNMSDFYFNLLTDKIINLIKTRLKEVKIKISAPEVFITLTTPNQRSLLVQQDLDLFKLLREIQRNKNSKLSFDSSTLRKIKQHTKKYDWLQYHYLGPTILNQQYFVELLKSLIKQKIVGQKKIIEIIKQEKETAQKQRELEKKLGFNQKELYWLRLAKEFVYLKALRKEITFIACRSYDSLLKEIAKRFNISLKQLQFMSPEEIFAGLTSQKIPSLNLLNERIKYCVVYYPQGQVKIYVGQKAKKLAKKIKEEEIEEELREFKGSPAFPGKVKGEVIVIFEAGEMKKMKDGGILVSPATNPNLMPAIRKAAAIITDEGGITCHAAIVSRELKIPCVIGTKIATKVLKDGDKVEVDATKGIVKKI